MSTTFAFDHLPVPHIVTPPPGPVAKPLLAIDEQYLSPSYTRSYPLIVDRASGAVILDVDGNRYLDFTAGIAVTATGHCHPEVVAAIQDQAAKLIHMSGTDFYYLPQLELAEKLAKSAPGPTPKRVFFTNSGAEALEAGLKLARWHTKRSRAVAFFGAFHGRTYGAMSLSGSKLIHRKGFSPLVPDIHHVPFPRECPATCRRATGGPCGLIQELEATILKRVAPAEEIAAIFVEPIQGEGGYHPIPAGCLPALRELCDRHGIMLVCDEVQSGMGRTGKLFAVEHYGVEPDILCTAKGIASGMPLGAIITKADVMDWPPGSHASTYGGNPIACRAALATLDLIHREYMANAAERGTELRASLNDLASRQPKLKRVRGMGLMVAVDVVTDHGEYNPALREKILDTCFERGLLLLGCGESAIRFCPPLCITSGHIRIAISILDDVLRSVAS